MEDMQTKQKETLAQHSTTHFVNHTKLNQQKHDKLTKQTKLTKRTRFKITSVPTKQRVKDQINRKYSLEGEPYT